MNKTRNHRIRCDSRQTERYNKPKGERLWRSPKQLEGTEPKNTHKPTAYKLGSTLKLSERVSDTGASPSPQSATSSQNFSELFSAKGLTAKKTGAIMVPIPDGGKDRRGKQ